MSLTAAPPPDLPPEWRWVRSHLLCDFVRGHSTSQLALNNTSEGIRYLRTSDLIGDLAFEKLDERYCAELPNDPVMKTAGEMVLTIEGFNRPDGRSTVGVPCWEGEGLLNNHVIKFQPKSPLLLKRFAEYAHGAQHVTDYVRAHALGAIAASAGPALRSVSIPLPSPDHQRRIAELLDGETARIDATLATKRRLLRLLADRQNSLRALWVQGCFQQFGQVALRRVWNQVEQGWSPSADTAPAEPDEWGILKTSAVTSGVFRPEQNKRLPESIDPNPRWTVRDGDLLVTRGSGTLANVGRAIVAHTEGRQLIMPDLIYRVHLSRGLPSFVCHVLSSPQLRSLIETSVRTDAGQTLKIRGDDLANLPIPQTHPAEQSELVGSLEDRLRPLKESVSALEEQLRLLAEHRQALITAAVTGQIDVVGGRPRPPKDL